MIDTPFRLTVTTPNGTREASFTHPLPASLREAIETLTEQEVFHQFLAGYKATIQTSARAYLRSLPPNGPTYHIPVSDYMRTWTLQTAAQSRRRTRDPLLAIRQHLEHASPEEKQAYIEYLSTQLGVPVSAPLAQPQHNGAEVVHPELREEPIPHETPDEPSKPNRVRSR